MGSETGSIVKIEYLYEGVSIKAGGNTRGELFLMNAGVFFFYIPLSMRWSMRDKREIRL